MVQPDATHAHAGAQRRFVSGPGSMAYELSNVARAGIGVQLESLGELLFTVPSPSVAGGTFDNLAMHADSGYVVVSGELH